VAEFRSWYKESGRIIGSIVEDYKISEYAAYSRSAKASILSSQGAPLVDPGLFRHHCNDLIHFEHFASDSQRRREHVCMGNTESSLQTLSLAMWLRLNSMFQSSRFILLSSIRTSSHIILTTCGLPWMAPSSVVTSYSSQRTLHPLTLQYSTPTAYIKQHAAYGR
jgi:hypothetical protein